MPQLVIDLITSLDGYGAAEGWPGFWGLEGPEYIAWLAASPEADGYPDVSLRMADRRTFDQAIAQYRSGRPDGPAPHELTPPMKPAPVATSDQLAPDLIGNAGQGDVTLDQRHRK